MRCTRNALGNLGGDFPPMKRSPGRNSSIVFLFWDAKNMMPCYLTTLRVDICDTAGNSRTLKQEYFLFKKKIWVLDNVVASVTQSWKYLSLIGLFC
jgi:hypothetical protein